MKKQKLCVNLLCAAACLVLAQAAFAQKNLSVALKRLGNSVAEKNALSEMFKPAAKVAAKDASLTPAAGRALSGAQAAAFKGEEQKVSASVGRALEQARRTSLAAYQVDTRVFLTDGFREKFAGYGNPVVFMNVSPHSSVGALELFNKLGAGMINRRMYVQTEDGSMIVLFNSYEQDLNQDLKTVLNVLAKENKYNSVQAFNVQTQTAYYVSGEHGLGAQHLKGENLEALARSLGRDKGPGQFRPLTPAAKANAVRFMQHTVLQYDPTGAMVVLEGKGIQKLAAQFPVRHAVLVKVTTPFSTRELTNTVWNRASGEKLNWEQNVFFQNGDYGDDVLLQTAVPELRQALKYDYRLIVHDAR